VYPAWLAWNVVALGAFDAQEGARAMFESASLVLLAVICPGIVAAAIAYAMVAFKLSPQDRRDYREAGGLDDYLED
jgi:hypothetical protein